MSCSKITEKGDEEPEEEADDTLVVVVKPDGTVAIDQATFNRVMESKKETMNIIHFENSSNKVITTNSENGEPEINLTVQGFYPSISTKTFLSQVVSGDGEINTDLLDLNAEQLEQLESSLTDVNKMIFGHDESSILDMLHNEKEELPQNPIYLDHCYYKDCSSNTSVKKNNVLCKSSIPLEVHNVTKQLLQSQIENQVEEIEEITVSGSGNESNDELSSTMIDVLKSNINPSHNLLNDNQPGNRRPLKGNKINDEKLKNIDVIKSRQVMTRKKAENVDQSNDSSVLNKTIKRILPMKSNSIRPITSNKGTRQKKQQNIVVDQIMLQANELVRQSSIEPKKYIQNQLMFKKNKEKLESNDNSSDLILSSTQKCVSKLSDVPELFSVPDIIQADDNKLHNNDDIEKNSKKRNSLKKEQNQAVIENMNSNLDSILVIEEKRVRKISNKLKDSPVKEKVQSLESSVTKTVEDILNDISSKIACQTEIIDEENLIDELADLNEDLNSSNFVAPSNSSHDLMNSLLSDESLNDSGRSITSSNDKSKSVTVFYGKSGRLITLPPVETPKTRSLVKKEHVEAIKKEDERQRKISETSKSFTDYSEESDTDRDGNMTSEDDPNRLWCVCRKPHNNRFMICCDTCEDWFHGKCVGVTKALGEQMEARGVEWNCPPCRKKKTDEARKKSEDSKIKMEEERKKKVHLKSPVKKIEGPKINSTSKQKCVSCSKDIEKTTSIFCDDNCLDKHIHESVTAIKACNTSESPDIILFDKKNSRLITGEQAPKITNLKQWMVENPTFQILKPSGPAKSKKSPIQTTSSSQKLTQSTLKFIKKEIENRPKKSVPSPDKVKTKDFKKELSDVQDLLQPDKVKLVFVKKDSQKLSMVQKESKPVIPQKDMPKSIQTSLSFKPSTQIQSKPLPVQKTIKKKPEPVKEISMDKRDESQLRSNVKKSLLESLSSRISEEPELKTAEENLDKLITNIEEELYNQFGKVDQKYKTKYRSLVFNIKDPKNLNFFKKIMFQWVTPYQLVRMTADEMASQELAEWRERENKHQIEMIRKTELDLMNQSKALVMKTHKGEEIIESKDKTCETIVPELNPDIKIEEKKPPILFKLPKEDRKDKKKSKYKERSHSRDHDRRHHKSSKNRHKSHKDKRHRSRDRSKDKKIEKVKITENKPDQPPIEVEIQKEDNISDREPSSTVVIATPPRIEEEASPIWKGTINFTDVARCNVTMTRLSGNITGLESELTLSVLQCVGRIKQQTVWEYMSKLKKTGTKDIVVTKLSASGIEQQMSYLSLYQYLSAKNRIAVIDNKPFPDIKDFYIYPLGSHSPIPQVLLPLDGPGVDDYRTHLLLGIVVRNSKRPWSQVWKPPPEDSYTLTNIDETIGLPHLKPGLPITQDSYSPKESYTPPRSPTNKILSLPTPVLPLTTTLTDDDLPYIPGEEEPYSPVDEDLPNISEEIGATTNIQQQMEELTRKIEKEKMMIQMMTAGSQSTVTTVDVLDPDEEVYSPTSELTPLTTDIQLPSNIKDILSSISSKESQSTDIELSKTSLDVEKKCRDPRQRSAVTSAAEPPPPGLEDEYPSPCNPDTSLPPPNYNTPYIQMNYIAPMPYPYPPPGYTYPTQYRSQQPPPPPIGPDQSNFNYNPPTYPYNNMYQHPPPPPPPPPPPYPLNKNKKKSGYWVGSNSKDEPKKKKYKKSNDRRDNKDRWRRM
ncbi:death-inducer obliterator 1 isoform X2 [Daktulosphaira vitifoliae]|uniref:death-inducer obliterator 1 isoform X2 n=1 Tax=Daktulosphaira vitifoliae TaxID=58002 RepID=UPI0021AA2D1C|nr:death-inducer obliterator 1 isoform X2 [Daktulosphaira vitifoliae]XP_050532701.1 death-inducer obliterator 1 isoform X2 [Daktulosphaira vitifoliae]XP_050532702.1 death-inducer obliterator 1 isoform X2 [Daktulosphaira vitifoliae]